MQILVIDIGNTRASLGFFHHDALIWRRDLPTEAICEKIETFIAERLDLCVISCVSLKAASLLDFVRAQVHCPVIDVQSTRAPLVIHYDHPEKLGQDRIANALGASIYTSTGAIVIDMGTATHFDILDSHGEFWGGPILAGVETMVSGLVARIPHLPSPALTDPIDPLSQNTESAIRTGTLLAAAGGIDRIVQEIKAVCDFDPKIILTGGNAHLVEARIQYDTWIPTLTLEGLCVYGIRAHTLAIAC